MAKAILSQPDIAVLYLRMSDERQERSIGDQRLELLAYAEKHGYKVLREYVDSAISGDDTARRTEFLRMREDSQKGKFNIVLCWDQDRFGRFDPIEGGYWILPFRNAGVRLETIAQGKIDWNDFAGRLIYLVQQEGKHAYLRDLSRNSIRGQIRKATEGKGSDGIAPYGYELVDGVRVIVPSQAEIVRRIFREYLLPGGSLRGIADRLNRDGIPSPTGRQWTSSTIRVILRNRKHTGAYVWGKENKGRYHSHQDGEIIPRSKTDKVAGSAPIVHEGKFETIINVKTFNQVQKLMEKRRNDTSPIRNAAGFYVLSGLLRCGHCGSVLAGQTVRRKSGKRRQYVCSGYHFGGKATCSMNSIVEAPLVDALIRLIEREYLSDEAIDRFRKVLQKRRKAQKQVVTVDTERLRKDIDKLDRQIEQGAERVFSAPAGIVNSLYAQLDKLRVQRDQRQAELQSAECGPKGSDNQEAEDVEEAIDALRNLRETFREAGPTEQRGLLSGLVSKVELYYKRHQHGQYARTDFVNGTIYIRPDPRLSSLVTPDGWCRVISCRRK